MSSTLRPLTEHPLLARGHSDMADFTLPQLPSWSDTYRIPDSFSSPPPSSSPPRTPYNPKPSYGYPHIHSSPQLGPRENFSTRSDHYEDYHPLLHRLGVPPTHLKSQPHLSTSLMARSTFMYKQRYSVVSDYDASEYSDNMDAEFNNGRSDLSSRNLISSASPLSDTRSEEQDDPSPGFSFSELGIYTMSFRTSAERGRWKTDPIPYRPPSLLPTRKSAPATEAVSDAVITSRPISEPAPSIPASVSSTHPGEIVDRTESSVPEVNSAPSPVVALSSLPPSPALGSMEPLPPLTSDRDSSMDVDELLTPSSPLPPSSPPPHSPAISLAHFHAQSPSLSPICSRASSPLLHAAPSSPLSPCSSEIGEVEDDDVDSAGPMDKVPTEGTVVAEGPCEDNLDQDGVSTISELDLTPTPHDHSTCASSHSIKLLETEPQVTCPALEPLPCSSLNPGEQVQEDTASRCLLKSPADNDDIAAIAEPSLPLAVSNDTLISDTTATTSHKRPISPSEPTSASADDNTVEPARKRQKTSDPEDNNVATPSTSTSPVLHEATKRKAAVAKRCRKDPQSTDPLSTLPRSSTTPNKQRKRKPKYIVEESESEDSGSESVSGSSSTSSSRRSSPVWRRPKLTFPDDGIRRDQNGIAEEDGEICGMIIEGMATSRASSLPISQICKIVMQSRPSMKAEKSEKEWRGVFDRILKSGVTGFGSGVFGKVDSSYKDENDPAVEARWFYVPEMDCDQERAGIIRSMMPRPGKRSVTKKYKQYYFQPLDKISRWDPEDDL